MPQHLCGTASVFLDELKVEELPSRIRQLGRLGCDKIKRPQEFDDLLVGWAPLADGAQHSLVGCPPFTR
jgi:hypothetical protein